MSEPPKPPRSGRRTGSSASNAPAKPVRGSVSGRPDLSEAGDSEGGGSDLNRTASNVSIASSDSDGLTAAPTPIELASAAVKVEDDDDDADGVRGPIRFDLPAGPFPRPPTTRKEELPYAPPFPASAKYYFHDEDSASNLVLGGVGSSGVSEVKAATLEKLVERVTYERYADPEFLKSFLLTYRSFTQPLELMELLINRYNMEPPPSCNTIEKLNNFQEEILRPVQLRVFNAFKTWITRHFYDFVDIDGLLDRCEYFIVHFMEPTGMKRAGEQLQKHINEGLRGTSASSKEKKTFVGESPEPLMSVDVSSDSLDLMSLPSEEIARQITLIEMDLYGRIKPWECLNQGWAKKGKTKSPNIIAMIERFNCTSQWVATMVVSAETLDKRKNVLCKFLDVAEHCKVLQNFNAMMEIMSGLQLSPVFRLKRTWAALPTRYANLFKEHQRFLSHEKSYKNLRGILNALEPPCIPYLGMFLTDLTFIEDGNKDLTPEGLINFTKRSKIAQVISLIQRYQDVPYYLEPIPGLQEYIMNGRFYDEDDMFKLSLIREPRGGGGTRGSEGASSSKGASGSRQGDGSGGESVHPDDELLRTIGLERVPGYRFYDEDSPENLVLEAGAHSKKQQIAAGTLEKIVERMTSQKTASPDLVREFLLSHWTVCSPETLLELLVQRFNMPMPKTKNEDLRSRFRRKTLMPVRLRVYNVMKNWIEKVNFGLVTHTTNQFRETFLRFLQDDMQTTSGMERPAAVLLEHFQALIETENERSRAIEAAQVADSGFTVDFDDDGDLDRLADQLVLMDWELWTQIAPYEFLVRVGAVVEHDDMDVSSERLDDALLFSELVQDWVERSTMALPTADRSARVGRLVKLANLCREKSSFKTAAAIIAGCKRQTLAQNQGLVPRSSIGLFSGLDTLMTPDSNYATWRETLASADACIPLLEPVLADVERLHADMPSQTSSGLINYGKIRAAYTALASIVKLQKETPGVAVNHPGLRGYIQEVVLQLED